MTSPALQAIFERARASVRTRDYPAAVQLYREALKIDDHSAEAIEGLAMVLFAAHEYPAAAEQFQQLTRLQPMVARHYVNLGALYNRQGEHRLAVDALRKAIQRDHRCADAYYNLGVAQRKLNQTTMAISAYKEALRLDPQLAEAYQNLGNIHCEMGSYHLAITNFRKALEIRPDFDKARLGLEQAEDAAERAKQNKNPFGRVVAEEGIAPQEAPTLTRELTEAERHADRQRVRALGAEMQEFADQSVTFLKEKLEPSLIELQKTVADGSFQSMTFISSVEDFQEALARWNELRKQMHAKADDLRAHEQLVNTPGSKIA